MIKWYRILKSFIFYGLLLLLWQKLFDSRIWPPYLFPAPRDVWEAFSHGIQDRSFLIGAWYSLQRILIGYGISLIFGILVGLVVSRFKLLDETFGSFLTGLQVLPSICWLPLSILWFGLSEAAIQFVVIMGAFLCIATATDSGIKNIPPVYLRAAKTMGVRGFALYWRVVLPASFPAIVTGMKLGWLFAWRSLLAGELIFSSIGVGHLLQVGRELNDMPQVMAVMVIIIIIGLIFDQLLFAPLETRVRKQWGVGSRN